MFDLTDPKLEDAAKRAVEAVLKTGVKPLKPGYKTTEFWITTLASAGALLASAAGFVPPQYAAICMALSAAAYAVSRGLAKQ